MRREMGSSRCRGETAASQGSSMGSGEGKLVPVFAVSAWLCREAGLLSNETRPV